MATAFNDDGSQVEGKSRYKTIKHLGEGQFANVYMAEDFVTGDIVAIKKVCSSILMQLLIDSRGLDQTWKSSGIAGRSESNSIA
jgi:hypothetical protein